MTSRPTTPVFASGIVLCLVACSDSSTSPATDPDATDITNAVFASRDASCSAKTGSYTSSVRDLGRNVAFTGEVGISSGAAGCTITSNSIPNHDFNNMGMFTTPVQEVVETFSVDGSPTQAVSSTSLTLDLDDAIFLNGVKLDLLAAACYGVGNEPLGQEKIGCNAAGTPWRYDPMYPGNAFGTDANNAHTQPDGGYHYHGDPLAMYDQSGSAASGVIGFAADGFPVFGPYVDDDGAIRRVRSGFTLKTGMRVSQPGEGAFPGGKYDGTFIDDWEWTDAGDLDECNGMTVDGVYGYYVTDTYPWVVGCFKGTPDASFRKG